MADRVRIAASEVDLADARNAIRCAVMATFGGDLLGTALVSVQVTDEDAQAYLDGATVDELLAAA